jgi:two-component system sensor histidine kinase KdpD
VHTFKVAQREDILALLSFLAVSVLVATLLTKALAQRARAEQGELEAKLLYRVSSKLLGGASLLTALDDVAADMVDRFGLARCEVTAFGPGGVTGDSTVMGWAGAAEATGPPVVIPLENDRGSFGEVRLFPSEAGHLQERHRRLAAAFAGQVALAVEAATLAEQSRRAQADAESSRVRAALFSAVTHDLRTPLASIKAAATSLLDQGVAFDQRQRNDLLSTIAEESDRLNRLIANLLSLSRLRSGAAAAEKTAVPVEDVIEAAAGRLAKRDGAVPIRIRIPRGAEIIPPVLIDLLQIDQVVTNLLENAIKYGAGGGQVEVEASAQEGWVTVAVVDHGPGVPPEDRERIFDEFFRRDTGGGAGGVGLGLAIARGIVEAHGGSILVEETPGGGATFRFQLPVGTVEPPAPSAEPPARSGEVSA